MAAKDKADEPRENRADAVEPGEPVEGVTPSQMGATFAERSGKKPPRFAAQANTTFAERAKASGKQVKSDDVEDKAVTSAQSKAKV